ncbi:hypothetical protein AWN76_002145 [Rhodothermaceae bacterium RA]|nr:hypothetical protein AWN76_002145 [Rhodothermaceae bacterium RA]
MPMPHPSARHAPPRALLLRAILLVLLVLSTTAGGAAAQAVDSTLVMRFRLADSFFRAGQFDRAITLLEDLYAASPETYAFYDKLKEAYESVKRYDDAIALVDGRLAQGNNPVLLAEKARLQYLQGDEETAFGTWDAAIAAAPDNRNTYRIVYQSLFQVRLFDRAIDVLERGRAAIGEDDLFQNDLAYLYNLTGAHERAMEEYIALLGADERKLSFVRSRLSRFIEQEDALQASIAAAERAVRKDPLNRAFRELAAWLYMEAERYQDALNAHRAIDRLEQENGRVLFLFARQAADAGAYDVALQAYQEILQRYPDAPTAPEARIGLGEMYEHRGHHTREEAFDAEGRRIPAPYFDNALAAYQQFLQDYPGHPLAPEVLRRIGELQLNVFFDLDEAEAVLREVIARFPGSDAVDQAEYDLGRIALLRGNLDEARLALARLEERLRTGELAERARYELALIHLYRGEWESARTLADAMEENTSTDVANDAIELKVLLIENTGPDSLNTPLQGYAHARLLLRQRRTPEAIAVLDSLLSAHGQHALADDVRFLRASALRTLGRSDEALAAFGEIPLMHPDSYLADRSLFAYAEILEQDLGRTREAIEAYTRLLTVYPGSLLAPEARLRIRTLRGEGT